VYETNLVQITNTTLLTFINCKDITFVGRILYGEFEANDICWLELVWDRKRLPPCWRCKL